LLSPHGINSGSQPVSFISRSPSFQRPPHHAGCRRYTSGIIADRNWHQKAIGIEQSSLSSAQRFGGLLAVYLDLSGYSLVFGLGFGLVFRQSSQIGADYGARLSRLF
jgi:hypothetical protein